MLTELKLLLDPTKSLISLATITVLRSDETWVVHDQLCLPIINIHACYSGSDQITFLIRIYAGPSGWISSYRGWASLFRAERWHPPKGSLPLLHIFSSSLASRTSAANIGQIPAVAKDIKPTLLGRSLRWSSPRHWIVTAKFQRCLKCPTETDDTCTLVWLRRRHPGVDLALK